MSSEKILLENYSVKRKYKFEKLDNPVSKRCLYTNVGNYTFDNYGVSYLDVSNYDFSNLNLKDMSHIAFSSTTKWPGANNLPEGFNPGTILKEATTCGEDFKKLHKQGITGEGITVAVIDSSFQGGDHDEFKEARLVKATLNNAVLDDWCHFHMECVLSKLVGKNLGVAPDCKVLCYEVNTEEDNSEEVVKCLNDIKRRLNEGERVSAVCISASIEEYYSFYKEYCLLVRELSIMGCEVVDSERFGEHFFCCGASFVDNDYKEASFIDSYSSGLKKVCNDKVNFVCSGRAIPEFCNDNGYKYEVIDCFSWCVPQAVGLYALCLSQIKLLSWEMFVVVCKKTSFVNKKGIRIVNPVKVIEIVKQIKDR